MTCSMSRRGNCYDNAVAESWFETLKAELGARFNNHSHAKEELFDYIEVFYKPAATSLGAGPRQSDRVREGCTAEAGGVVQLSTEAGQVQALGACSRASKAGLLAIVCRFG
jgi:hypothetical protein